MGVRIAVVDSLGLGCLENCFCLAHGVRWRIYLVRDVQELGAGLNRWGGGSSSVDVCLSDSLPCSRMTLDYLGFCRASQI